MQCIRYLCQQAPHRLVASERSGEQFERSKLTAEHIGKVYLPL
jgi:hypothetical protein